MTILFVCSGNTCRSPLAVAAWRHWQRREKESALRNVTVLSAGIAARKGAPVSPRAVEVARNWGVNLEAHRARVLAPETLRRATLICPMTAQQALQLHAEFPEIAAPIVPLGHYENRRSAAETSAPETPADEEERRFRALLEAENDLDILDIADPFGASYRVYRDCGAHILRCVRGLRRALDDEKPLRFTP